MKCLNPYLIFDGDCEEAFSFYQSVLGGEIAFTLRLKDGPDGDKVPAEDADKILHICLPLRDEQMLMASDMVQSMCPGENFKFQKGNTSFIAIYADSETEARTIFTKLSEGGQVFVPLSQMFWGDIFGQFVDRYGIQWMVSAQTEKNQYNS